MVTLSCALVGKQESVFAVDMEENKLVHHLKKAIKRVTEDDISCSACKLKLYLAKKKDNKWLESDSDDVKKLKKGEQTATIQELMHEDKELDGECGLVDILAKMPTPSTDQIHVLVVVPEREATTTTTTTATGLGSVEELGEIIEARINKVLKERDEKMSEYSFSRLNSELEQRLVKKMRLMSDIPNFKEPVDCSIPGYKWIPTVDDESKTRQRAGCMVYLQEHLKPLLERGNFVLDDIAGDDSVLTIVDPRLPFRINGTADVLLIKGPTADVLLIKGPTKNPLIKLAGVCMVIELKTKVEPCHVAQAIGQLVSCSIKAPLHCYPLSLLTDLNDHWHFSWFSDKHVMTQITLKYPKNAFKFIEAVVSEPTEPEAVPLPFMSVPFKKLRVDDFLPMPDDGAAEMMERYELMADVLEPEFLMARRLEYAQHLVQSEPAYRHMYL